MTTYYIFRHGQTKNSKYHLPYPKDNRLIKILPEAVPSLKKLAEYLKNVKSDYNVSSEYLRCRQSTDIVTKISGLNFERDRRLNEKSQESFEDFKKRVKSFLEDMEKENYKTVVICTHGAVIAAMRRLLLKKSVRVTNLPFYPKTGVLMIIKGNEIKYVDFNNSKTGPFRD